MKLNTEQQIQMAQLRSDYKERGRRLTDSYKDVADSAEKFSEVFEDMPTDKVGLEQRLLKLVDFRSYWRERPVVVPSIDTSLVKDKVAESANMMSSYISRALDLLNEARIEAREEWIARLTEDAAEGAKQTERLTRNVVCLTKWIALMTLVMTVATIVNVVLFWLK